MTNSDLQVVTLREKVIIAPRSAVGMLWLQSHFEEKEWDTLSNGSFLLTRAEAAMMVEDAEDGGLLVDFG